MLAKIKMSLVPSRCVTSLVPLRCMAKNCENNVKEIQCTRDTKNTSAYDFAAKLTKIHRCDGKAYHEYGVCLPHGDRFAVGQFWQDIAATMHLLSHMGFIAYTENNELGADIWIQGDIRVSINLTQLLLLFPQLVAVCAKDPIPQIFAKIVTENTPAELSPFAKTWSCEDKNNYRLVVDEIAKNSKFKWSCVMCGQYYEEFPDAVLVALHLEKCIV